MRSCEKEREGSGEGRELIIPTSGEEREVIVGVGGGGKGDAREQVSSDILARKCEEGRENGPTEIQGLEESQR